MRIDSKRQVGLLWAGTLVIFLICAWAATVLAPVGPTTRPTASYYVGLAGLMAIGIALVLTWRWFKRSGPESPTTRAALKILISFAVVLWLAAMLFPFL